MKICFLYTFIIIFFIFYGVNLKINQELFKSNASFWGKLFLEGESFNVSNINQLQLFKKPCQENRSLTTFEIENYNTYLSTPRTYKQFNNRYVIRNITPAYCKSEAAYFPFPYMFNIKCVVPSFENVEFSNYFHAILIVLLILIIQIT